MPAELLFQFVSGKCIDEFHLKGKTSNACAYLDSFDFMYITLTVKLCVLNSVNQNRLLAIHSFLLFMFAHLTVCKSSSKPLKYH